MTKRTTPRVFGSLMTCPECLERVRNLPPTDWAPSWNRPDYSHRDGSTLCATYGDLPGQTKSGAQTVRPVVFVPLKEFTSA
ncbi:hypothetical protein KIK06_14905 [Nocardiopsis sp. EMB25]|uniref:hypothetical protein n=1 Tax=Nocardiopsis sp. EMB25 TaxID=2835867 RepID=UPI002283761D|nr:hypothetical protein [Nocardiopsis sp. EMB25]MCY9785172.1 hypothetical protein [Nocardiopsis sp. EMB25]